MAVEKFYQNEGKNLALFFGNAKRLQLLQPILTKVIELQEKLQRPLTILDVGAGTGMHAAHLAAMGHTVTAVDPADAMLSEGKKQYNHDNLTFVVDSLPNLERIGNRQYDIIYSIAAWQYISPEDRQRAMMRCTELLAPGGVLGIIWPVPMSRELQYSLSDEDLFENMEKINAMRRDERCLATAAVETIKDPDNRCGYVETTKPVYFHSMLLQSSLTLEHHETYEIKPDSVRLK